MHRRAALKAMMGLAAAAVVPLPTRAAGTFGDIFELCLKLGSRVYTPDPCKWLRENLVLHTEVVSDGHGGSVLIEWHGLPGSNV